MMAMSSPIMEPFTKGYQLSKPSAKATNNMPAGIPREISLKLALSFRRRFWVRFIVFNKLKIRKFIKIEEPGMAKLIGIHLIAMIGRSVFAFLE